MVKTVDMKNLLKTKYSLKEKILKLLIENKRIWTILGISNELKSDYKNTFQAVGKLYPDLIYKEKKGNLNLVEIKINSDREIYEVEEKRTNEFLFNNSKMRLIKEDIKRINYPFFIVLIFGSIVKGNATDKSDIDICIVSDNPEKTKEIVSSIRLLPQTIEIQQFTTDEFKSMLNKKENNLAKEIVKKNIILFGTENYYALISKWMKKE